MPRRPNPLNPSASPLAFFGSELRRYRELAGLSQDELGSQVFVTGSFIGAVERAESRCERELPVAADTVLDTRGALTAIWDGMLKNPGAFLMPDFLKDYAEAERQAKTIREYAGLAVPGLLQTADYTHALLSAGLPAASAEEVERLVAARMERQEIAAGREQPPMLWAVIDETVLMRPVGGPQVHRAQLKHLEEQAQRPGVVINVIPLATGAHAGFDCPFVLLDLEDGTQVAYADDPAGGRLVEAPKAVEAFQTVYEALRAVALPITASLDVIRSAAKE